MLKEQVFTSWQKHRGAQKLLICTSCKADSECNLLASTLKMPRIALIDADALKQLIAEHPEVISVEEPKHKHKSLVLKRIAARLINRKNTPRCILFFLSMLIMYIFSGNLMYLICSVLLFFTAALSFHHKSRPVKLF